MSVFLIVDIRASGSRVGLVSGGSISWKTSASPRSAVGLVARQAKALARRRPAGIAVIARTDATFSNARSAAAIANALAFSWNVPTGRLMLDDDATDADIARAAAAECTANRAQRWLAPAYNAEPNITTPKKSKDGKEKTS